MTFFSFRVFSASTFTRKWPSMNGPFFSDRGIWFLFLHPSQFHPLRAAKLSKSAHRARHSVRNRAKRANKTCSLCMRRFLNRYCPTRPAQPKQNLGWGRELRNCFHHRLCSTARNCFPRPRAPPGGTSRRSGGCHRALNSPPRRVHIFWCSKLGSGFDSRTLLRYGLRRSTIIRSLGRFFRVFAPRVGKPQGVCGWFPFTRPSPPPCGWSTGFMATPRFVGRRPCHRVRPAFP